MSLNGSEIAKSGFQNEDDVISKFNNWQTDISAQMWIKSMGYDIYKVKKVSAMTGKQARKEIERRLGIKFGRGNGKTDVRVCVILETQKDSYLINVQVKLASIGFNQIDKRSVNNYKQLWNIPENITNILKRFTGEITPNGYTRDPRRMFMDEFSQNEQKSLIDWIKSKKIIIINDIIKGNIKYLQAEYMLVVKNYDNQYCSVIKPINFVINHFGNGEVKISPKGSINIGKILMQRKGGDGGKETSKYLQFKVNPTDLFNI